MLVLGGVCYIYLPLCTVERALSEPVRVAFQTVQQFSGFLANFWFRGFWGLNFIIPILVFITLPKLKRTFDNLIAKH